MKSRLRLLTLSLVGVQVAETLASATPNTSMASRLDHLGVPDEIRPLLPVIKVSTSVGLLVGLRWAPVGTATSAAMVAFYSSALGLHWFAADRPTAAVPALAVGAVSALCFFDYLSRSSKAASGRDVD
jgi:DoxX-like family